MQPLSLERSDLSLAEFLRQPAPVDHGPIVCRNNTEHETGVTFDGLCPPCFRSALNCWSDPAS